MSRAVRGYSYATALLVLFILSAVLSVAVIAVVTRGYQAEQVRHIGQQEARTTSQQIFEHLYSVMRKGWTRDELDEVLLRMRQARPDIELYLIRSASVASQYGEHDDSARRRQDPLVARVMASGETGFEEHDGRMRYVLPMRTSGECLRCHGASPLGSVNGVIELAFSVDQLKAPLEATLASTLAIVAGVGCGMFLLAYVLLRKGIADPLTRMAGEMEHIVDHSDYSRRIAMAAHGPVELRQLALSFNALLADVQVSHEELREASHRDPLTGLYNRRYFEQAMAELQARKIARGASFAVYLIDLDGFKPINDEHGHPAGDKMLCALANCLRHVTGHADIVGRLGGDEFVILAPEIESEDNAAQLLEQLRHAIAGTRVRWGQHYLQVSASIGMAYCGCREDCGHDLLADADAAMYLDKQQRKAGR